MQTFTATQQQQALVNYQPKTFTEYTMLFILAGGKFSEADFIRFSGFGGKQAAAAIRWGNGFKGKQELTKAKQRQYIHENGKKMDLFVLESNSDFNSPFTAIDEMDGINTIVEILCNYTREQMKDFLLSRPENELIDYPVEMDNNLLPAGLEMITYSEKSFVVFGQTFNIKETLKKYGGRFNPYLTHPATLEALKGWVFPVSRKEILVNILSSQKIF